MLTLCDYYSYAACFCSSATAFDEYDSLFEELGQLGEEMCGGTGEFEDEWNVRPCEEGEGRSD